MPLPFSTVHIRAINYQPHRIPSLSELCWCCTTTHILDHFDCRFTVSPFVPYLFQQHSIALMSTHSSCLRIYPGLLYRFLSGSLLQWFSFVFLYSSYRHYHTKTVYLHNIHNDVTLYGGLVDLSCAGQPISPRFIAACCYYMGTM